MNRTVKFFIAIHLIWAAACSQPQSQPHPIPAQAVAVQPGTQLIIQADHGRIEVRPVEGQEIRLSGSIAGSGEVKVQGPAGGSEVRIWAPTRRNILGGRDGATVQLYLEVPAGVSLRVETFDGAVDLDGLSGVIEVNSAAGDIRAESLSGTISLRSGRGDIQAKECSGRVRIIGEHGLLTVDHPAGEVGISTIMGTIRFTGQPGVGDAIRLETDHGPVEVELEGGADLRVRITSTSGALSCVLPDLQQSLRACSGTLGAGSGELNVRTVSGNVALRQAP